MYAQDNILCQFGLFCHKFTTVSPPILSHFRWELYQTSLHYPNSRHNTLVKTRIPLMIQLQYQPLPKLHVIIPSNLSLLITPIDIPVQWFKFIHPSPKPRMTKSPFQSTVHVAYSPIASMNYKWTINLHDGYPLFQVMKSEGYTTPPLHILKHDLSSPASPKGEMKSSFSWTSLFKSPTSSTLCFGEPTLGKLNQVKLLCSISSST